MGKTIYQRMKERERRKKRERQRQLDRESDFNGEGDEEEKKEDEDGPDKPQSLTSGQTESGTTPLPEGDSRRSTARKEYRESERNRPSSREKEISKESPEPREENRVQDRPSRERSETDSGEEDTTTYQEELVNDFENLLGALEEQEKSQTPSSAGETIEQKLLDIENNLNSLPDRVREKFEASLDSLKQSLTDSLPETGEEPGDISIDTDSIVESIEKLISSRFDEFSASLKSQLQSEQEPRAEKLIETIKKELDRESIQIDTKTLARELREELDVSFDSERIVEDLKKDLDVSVDSEEITKELQTLLEDLPGKIQTSMDEHLNSLPGELSDRITQQIDENLPVDTINRIEGALNQFWTQSSEKLEELEERFSGEASKATGSESYTSDLLPDLRAIIRQELSRIRSLSTGKSGDATSRLDDEKQIREFLQETVEDVFEDFTPDVMSQIKSQLFKIKQKTKAGELDNIRLFLKEMENEILEFISEEINKKLTDNIEKLKEETEERTIHRTGNSLQPDRLTESIQTVTDSRLEELLIVVTDKILEDLNKLIKESDPDWADSINLFLKETENTLNDEISDQISQHLAEKLTELKESGYYLKGDEKMEEGEEDAEIDPDGESIEIDLPSEPLPSTNKEVLEKLDQLREELQKQKDSGAEQANEQINSTLDQIREDLDEIRKQQTNRQKETTQQIDVDPELILESLKEQLDTDLFQNIEEDLETLIEETRSNGEDHLRPLLKEMQNELRVDISNEISDLISDELDLLKEEKPSESSDRDTDKLLQDMKDQMNESVQEEFENQLSGLRDEIQTTDTEEIRMLLEEMQSDLQSRIAGEVTDVLESRLKNLELDPDVESDVQIDLESIENSITSLIDDRLGNMDTDQIRRDLNRLSRKVDNLEGTGSPEREEVRKRIETFPNFQVNVNSIGTICPYCRVIVPSEYDFLEHIVNRCEKYTGPGTKPLAVETLKEWKKYYEINHWLNNRKEWSIFDGEGHWFCPFCIERTDVQLQDDSDFPELYGEIIDHFERCPEYGKWNEPVKPLKDILGARINHESIQNLLPKIKDQVDSEDERYVQSTPDGKWVCPICLHVLPNIDVDPFEEFKKDGPGAIARHLVEECRAANRGESEKELEKIREVAETRTGQISTEYGSKYGIPRKQAGSEEGEPGARVVEARRIQENMLPDTAPSIDGYEIAFFYQPHKYVGGDFYDFLEFEDSRTGLVIGDVSGKGTDAALVMSLVKKVLNIHAKQDDNPVEVLARTNSDIRPELEIGKFISCEYGILNAETHEFSMARAGHNEMLHFNKQNQAVSKIKPAGPALNLYNESRFRKQIELAQIEIGEGDILLCFTDGLTEAINSDGEKFGVDRVSELLLKHGDNEVEDCIREIVNSHLEFVKEQGEEDDVTIVGLRRIED